MQADREEMLRALQRRPAGPAAPRAPKASRVAGTPRSRPSGSAHRAMANLPEIIPAASDSEAEERSRTEAPASKRKPSGGPPAAEMEGGGTGRPGYRVKRLCRGPGERPAKAPTQGSKAGTQSEAVLRISEPTQADDTPAPPSASDAAPPAEAAPGGSSSRPPADKGKGAAAVPPPPLSAPVSGFTVAGARNLIEPALLLHDRQAVARLGYSDLVGDALVSIMRVLHNIWRAEELYADASQRLGDPGLLADRRALVDAESRARAAEGRAERAEALVLSTEAELAGERRATQSAEERARRAEAERTRQEETAAAQLREWQLERGRLLEKLEGAEAAQTQAEAKARAAEDEAQSAQLRVTEVSAKLTADLGEAVQQARQEAVAAFKESADYQQALMDAKQKAVLDLRDSESFRQEMAAAGGKAVAEFRESDEYRRDLSDYSVSAFRLGFEEFRLRAAEVLPSTDLSGVALPEAPSSRPSEADSPEAEQDASEADADEAPLSGDDAIREGPASEPVGPGT